MRNCFTYVWMKYKFSNVKQYFSFRKSFWGYFPHFQVSEEQGDFLIKKEYVPNIPIKRWLPALFFDGKVITTTYLKISTIESEWDD